MYLVKSVRQTHKEEALKHGRIRVGTINYYRSIEDAERKDANEGLGSVVWKGDRLEADDHNRIFGPFDKHHLAEGWTIENRGVPLIGAYPNFNSFVFCYSEVSSISEIASTSRGKASRYYYISNLKEFVDQVTVGIRDEIENLIREHAPEEHVEMMIENLEIVPVTYKVFYSDIPKDRVVTESNVTEFNPWSFHPQDLFHKNSSFSYEKEVRTAWIPITKHPDTGKPMPIPIPPDTDYVDLELGRLPISGKKRRNRAKIKTSSPKPSGG